MAKISLNQQIVDAATQYIVRFMHDPVGFVKTAFPWGQPGTPLEKQSGPYEWQLEVLTDIAEGLKTPEYVIKNATASGNGIGKSALTSWIILWAFSTYPDCRGVVTANTEGQLRTKTWAELSKWYNMFLLKDFFQLDGTCLHSIDAGHERTWRVDAIPWSANNPEAMAGLHNQGKREFIIFDEASAIADEIWEAMEGATMDVDTEVIWCAFGNPTRRDGAFYECFHKNREIWKHRQIDSRTVPGTNLNQIEDWKKQYGEDSDWFKVHVKGEFPSSNELQYISQDLVDTARARVPKKGQFEFAPVILGLDASWMGNDFLVIYKRQGILVRRLLKIRHNDNDVAIAAELARFEDEHNADAVNIDLGYGTGIYSAGKLWGREWNLVSFAAKSARSDCANKRAEMYANCRDWLIEGGCLPPDDQELADDLTAPELVPNPKGLIQLEKKEQIKKRLNRSTDYGDAFVITFAYPVVTTRREREREQASVEKYDPFKDM